MGLSLLRENFHREEGRSAVIAIGFQVLPEEARMDEAIVRLVDHDTLRRALQPPLHMPVLCLFPHVAQVGKHRKAESAEAVPQPPDIIG